MNTAHTLNPAPLRPSFTTGCAWVVATLLLAPPSGQAAVRTWTGGYFSSYWSAPLNWDTGAPDAGDDLVFPLGAAHLTNTNNLGSRTFRSITFSGTGYVLRGTAGGATIGLTHGIQANTSGSANTIELNIELMASQTFVCNISSATLYVNGDVDLGGYALATFGAGQVHLGGAISGTGGLTKTGSGTHWLDGASVNTYTGPTEVESGTLMLAKTVTDGAIRYGSLTVGDGLGSADTTIVREADDYQIGAIPITVNSDGWLDVDDYQDTVGAITFNGGHAGSAAGELRLGGHVTVHASSSEALLSGRVYLGAGTRTCEVADGAAGYDLRVTAALSGGSLTKTGGGVMALQGVNTYTGATTVDGGRLYVLNDSGLGGTAGGTSIGSSGYLQLVNANVGLEPLTLGRTDSGLVLYASGTCGWEGDVVLNQDAGMGTSGTMVFSGAISGAGGISITSGSFTFSGSSANTYLGTTRVEHGSLSLSTLGGAINHGELIIGDEAGGDPAYVLQTSHQVGAIPVTVNSSGEWTLDDFTADTIGALTLNGGRVTLDGTLTLGGDLTVLNNADRLSRISGGFGALGLNATRTFDIAHTPFSPDLEMHAPIVGSGGFTKTGAGVLTLYNASTYTGETTVNQGQVNAEDAAAFGDTAGGTTVNGSGIIQLVGTAVGKEPLTLDKPAGSGPVLSASGVSGWAGDITLNETAGISTGGTLDLGGAISGAGGLTFLGDGDLVLSGPANNVYTGPTMVEDGRLLMDKDSPRWAVGYGSLTVGDGLGDEASALARELGNYQLGSIPVTVNSDGLLDLNNFNDTVGNSLTLNGGDVETGSGTLTLGANSQITAGPAWPPSHVSGNISVGSGACTVTVPDLLYFDASVSGSADITKTGDGYLYLMSSNSFAGMMIADEGTLSTRTPWSLGSASGGTYVNNSARLGIHAQFANESLTMNSSHYNGAIYSSSFTGPPQTNGWDGTITLLRDTTVRVTDGYTLDISGQIDGTGGLIKNSEGTLVLSCPTGNNYAGDTLVREGVLELEGVNVIRQGTLTVGTHDSGQATDIVRFLSNSPIHSAANLVVNSDGRIDFNGHTDDLGHVLFDRGQISTGPGTLWLNDEVAVIESFNTNWTAFVSGNVELRFGAMHAFDIGTGASFNLTAETVGTGGITKTGGGSLFLTGANSYEGETAISEGRVYADDDESLGATTAGTTVSDGAALVLRYGAQVGGEPLTLRGPGDSSLGALASIYGVNEWAGPITLATSTRVTTLQATDELVLSGPISGGGDLTIEGNGTVTYAGSDANIYTGDTYVNRGTLLLNKSVVNSAVVGDVYIGDGIGGADADVLRLGGSVQIPTSTRIIIADSGLFDMNNMGEAFGSLAGSGRVAMGAGSVATGHDNTSSTYSGLIEGAGRLRKYGLGTLTLTGDNTYSGDTEINAGTLLVNGSQPSSDVLVGSAGRLGGFGTVGSIDDSGAVAPGASPGHLGAGPAQFRPGSTFEVEFNGYAPVDCDRLDVNGTATIDNAELTVSWGFVPAVGDTFTIIDNDGADAVVGTFNGLPDGASLTAGNVTLQIDYQGGDGNDVVLAAAQVFPLEDLRFRSIGRSSGDAVLQWIGGVPFFQLNKKVDMGTNTLWQPVGPPTRNFEMSVPADTDEGYYQIIDGN